MSHGNAVPPPGGDGQRDFGSRRTLLIATGALSASFLPFWLNWAHDFLPETEIDVVLTRGARRFVSRPSLAALASGRVLDDEWGDGNGSTGGEAPHVRWAQWADTILVYPATAHFLARYALGLSGTPALLTLQCFSGPIGLAPALPPGTERSPQVQGHLATLSRLDHVVTAPSEPARSATGGRMGEGGVTPLPKLLALVEERRRRLDGSAVAGPEEDDRDVA